MAAPPPSDAGLTGAVRRAVGGALEATVGRVGQSVTEAALEVTGATAQQIIEDLEPYLISEAVPRIVEGITPLLVGSVVPDVLEGISNHLIEVTIPDVVDGVTEHLIEVTVPEVVAGVTPRLVADLLPQILADLRPYLESELVPGIVDALLPHLETSVAPQLVDSLVPKIRAEVVPTVLDDIVEDPRVRDLIREQSQGLLLDAVEGVRQALANGDDLVERLARRVLALGRRPRPVPIAMTPPYGRDHSHAGLVTRLVALALDLTVAIWLISQGLSAALNVMNSLFGSLPAWVSVFMTGFAASLAPNYLGLSWWLTGRSLGSQLVGFRVTRPDGRRPGFVQSFVRAWIGVLGIVIWVVGMIPSLYDPARRGFFDRITRTETRYFVHEDQQRRHKMERLAAEAAAPAAAPAATAAPVEEATPGSGDGTAGGAPDGDRPE